MNIHFSAQREISPPPSREARDGGGQGGGPMHKRTSPQVFAHAKELRREMTPMELKLWARLRAHRMKGVHFRPQHAIGIYIVDFPWHRPPGRCAHRARSSLLNWMALPSVAAFRTGGV